MRVAACVRALGGLLAAWALWNAATVYLVFGGERQHRLETAMLLLVSGAILSELVVRTRPLPAPAVELDPGRRLVVLGVAVVAWVVVWTTVAGVPFLSDDYVLLARYADAASASPQQFFRPVFGALFSALSWAGSEATLPFRLASALLHLASAALASQLTARIAGSATAGTVAFVVFVLNPLQAEAVVWIAGLQETLWTFLALGALAVHAQDDWPPILRMGVVAGLCGLAFGAKETAA
jgi:hypothetical protein